MSEYTDIAFEKCSDKVAKLNQNLQYGCEEVFININSTKKQDKYGLQKGQYYFLECPNMPLLAPIVNKYIIEQVAKQIGLAINKSNKKYSKVLVVGLGNESYITDSLGSRALKGLITGQEGPNGRCVYGFCPGVLGQTGIETAVIVKSVVESIKPDLVILIDSLCALNITRLGTSIQLSTAGITPGNAGERQGQIINAKYLKTPTLTIGVPLVVKIETIIKDVLSDLSEDMQSIDFGQIRKLGKLMVTPKDIDNLIKTNAFIISSAINMSILGIDIDEQKVILDQ